MSSAANPDQAVRHRVGMMLQESGFAGDLTLYETLELWARIADRRDNADATLARLDLAEHIAGPRLLAGRALTAGEIRALFAVCATDPSVAGRRDAAVIAVLYNCGLRCAELVGLDVDAYDAGGDIKVVGKRNRQRLVHVTGGAVAALAGWLACRGDHSGALFCAINKDGTIASTAWAPRRWPRCWPSGRPRLVWPRSRRTIFAAP